MRQSFSIAFIVFCISLMGCEARPASSSGLASTEASPSPSASSPAPAATYPCLPTRTRRDLATLISVTTGDTVTVSIDGAAFVICYIGVAAPDPASDPAGAEAAAVQNRALLAAGNLVLIRDVSETDSAGRLPRYILADSIFLNEQLLRLGVLHVSTMAPDDSCDRELLETELAARSARLGLWQFTEADRTKTAVAACTGACLTPSPGCRIKGNINSKGEKIFHLPGTRDYERTVIEPEKGERWFCTEAEAIAAGWRGGKS